MNAEFLLVSHAAQYALDATATVTRDLWSQPTPCSRWDLHMLLRHTCESIAALHQGLATGQVALFAPSGEHATVEPNELFRARLAALVAEWPESPMQLVDIAGRELSISVLADAAALEIAVHGWDIAEASGQPHPIPSDLAEHLLAVAARLLADGNRHPLFAPPIPVVGAACPGDRLLAFLGRRCGETRPTQRKACMT